MACLKRLHGVRRFRPIKTAQIWVTSKINVKFRMSFCCQGFQSILHRPSAVDSGARRREDKMPIRDGFERLIVFECLALQSNGLGVAWVVAFIERARFRYVAQTTAAAQEVCKERT